MRSVAGQQEPDERVMHLVQLAQQHAGDELSLREQSGLGRLEKALEARRARRGRTWAYGLGFAAVFGGVLAVAFLRTRALSFEVVNGSVSDGGYIRPALGADALLRFSDGSEVKLERETRARVTELKRAGATMLIESGKAHVHVIHRSDSKWALDAGPFTVHVTGTEFEISWASAEEQLDVRLRNGSVIIKGPLTPAGLGVEAGQHLLVNLKEETVTLNQDSDATPTTHAAAESDRQKPASTEASSTDDSLPPDQAVATEDDHQPLKHRNGRGSHGAGARWGALVAQGQFDAVLEETARRGLEVTLARAPLDDLAALADAARYSRRDDWARRALLAERSRFPHARRAREAAFFLGGLAEGDSELSQALDWYARYLGEAPEGAYASQALGRKMVLVRKLQGAPPAAQVAQEYLRRFPDGPYASSAKKMATP
jgi:hypothetical protein